MLSFAIAYCFIGFVMVGIGYSVFDNSSTTLLNLLISYLIIFLFWPVLFAISIGMALGEQ
jgi:hypothetical protein